MWPNIFYIIILIIIPYFIIFILNKYFKKLDKNYSSITLIILSTFIGAFLAISLTSYTKENDEKELYLSILQSDLNICKYELSSTNYFLNNFEKTHVSFSVQLGISYANNPLLIQEIIRNPYYYKYTSESFKNYLPTMINMFRSLNLITTNSNFISELKRLKNYLVFRQTILSNEVNFIKNNIVIDEVAKLNLSALKKVIDIFQVEVDSLSTIKGSLKNKMDSLKIKMDSLKILLLD